MCFLIYIVLIVSKTKVYFHFFCLIQNLSPYNKVTSPNDVYDLL